MNVIEFILSEEFAYLYIAAWFGFIFGLIFGRIYERTMRK